MNKTKFPAGKEEFIYIFKSMMGSKLFYCLDSTR